MPRPCRGRGRKTKFYEGILDFQSQTPVDAPLSIGYELPASMGKQLGTHTVRDEPAIRLTAADTRLQSSIWKGVISSAQLLWPTQQSAC